MSSRKIFLFMCCVVALLALLCAVFPRESVTLTLRMPSLHKILYGSDPANEVVDSLDLTEIADTVTATDSIYDADTSIKRWYCTIDTLWNSSDGLGFSFPNGDSHYFDDFFATLRSAASEGRYVRILHYGDSQIELDRMSGNLRRYLQQHFGGGGPGLQPFHPVIPTPIVSHYCGDELTHLAPYGDSTVVRSRGHYGPMTQCFRVDGTASATFNVKKSPFGPIARVAVLYDNRPGPMEASLNCAKNDIATSSQIASVGCREWRLDSAVTSIKVTLRGGGDAYGIMLDGAPGVAVDNIPMRGCSGQQFTLIDSTLLAAAYQQMDVALVILQFGGNSVPYLMSENAIKSYCYSIGRQIDRIHQCCPNAKILFIGPSDMDTRINGDIQSYPALASIVEMLRQTANSHGAAFWSIYHAMGGHNSMAQWVSDGLAVPDYIHFSTKGANIMGNKLVDAFERIRR